MKLKYIGIHEKNLPKTRGNLGDIWTEQEDGTFTCPTKKKISGERLVLTKEDMEKDLKNGYLKEYNE